MIDIATNMGTIIGVVISVSLIIVAFFAFEWALMKLLRWFILDARKDVAQLQDKDGGDVS